MESRRNPTRVCASEVCKTGSMLVQQRAPPLHLHAKKLRQNSEQSQLGSRRGVLARAWLLLRLPLAVAAVAPSHPNERDHSGPRIHWQWQAGIAIGLPPGQVGLPHLGLPALPCQAHLELRIRDVPHAVVRLRLCGR